VAGTVPEEPRCTVERADASLTYSLFLQRFAFSRPVILGGVTDNSAFRALCTREKLLAAFGPFPVRLSTANTYSYRKGWDWARNWDGTGMGLGQDWARIRMGLGQDWDGIGTGLGWDWAGVGPGPEALPSTTPLLPPGSGSGVPFHWHGPGFSEVIFGRKRWFLYPPDQTPHFHPNETTLAWLQHTYPTLPPAQRPLECTLRPGEVLYFPDRWWHATLNLDTSVFISTFLG
ncbi:JMJD8 protein, partial [Calcarius ornatus]|nr:JMJD8 protein [Calcarius ornatus]